MSNAANAQANASQIDAKQAAASQPSSKCETPSIPPAAFRAPGAPAAYPVTHVEGMRTIEAVAAVIAQDGRVLATQRGYGETEGGWEFPGGKMEPGETPEQAIVREIAEELDARIEVTRYLCTVENDMDTRHLVMHCFLARIPDGQFKLLEHKDARWVNRDTIRTVGWLPADIMVVNQLREQGVI